MKSLIVEHQNEIYVECAGRADLAFDAATCAEKGAQR